MHRFSTCCVIVILIVVALTLIVNPCSGDWVEIPYLQPSTTTQKTTIIRKNINRPAFAVDSGFMSHVLPPSFAIASDRGESEESEEDEEDGEIFSQSPVNHATLSTPVRITSLLDFEEFRRRSTTSTSTTESPFNGFPEKYSHFQKRIYEYPRVNVSTKLGWTTPKDEMHFVMNHPGKTSPGQVDRQPMSNKYQEESIEYLNGVAPHRPPFQTVNDRVELPVHSSAGENDRPSEEVTSSEEKDTHSSTPNRTVEERPLDRDRFHDFDDYDDEVHPLESFRNVTIVKRRRRPGPPGQVTIVKVFPARRHHLRPTTDPNSEGGLSAFVNFLKRMQDKFMQRTAKNIGDKIKILQDLKDQLLLSIERKMTTLWRDRNEQTGREDDQKKGNRRVKRGGGGWMDYGDHGGGHGGMDFPSAEAALLTISFLTFAVFLIKLVLQVINTIKSKHYTYNTLAGMNGVTGATLKIVNRSRRSTDPNAEDHWKHNLDILSAINSYKFS